MAKQRVQITIIQNHSGGPYIIEALYSSDGVIVKSQKMSRLNRAHSTADVNLYDIVRMGAAHDLQSWAAQLPLWD